MVTFGSAADAAADVAFEEGPARTDHRPVADQRRAVTAGLEPTALVEVERLRAAGKKFVHDAGKERRDLPQAAGQQRVGVAPLRNSSARRPVDRELVAVQDRDSVEMVGEDPRGREATHAPPDDDGVFTVLATHGGSS